MGEFVKSVVEEMKSRGGLINRQDFEDYSCLITSARVLSIGSSQYYLTGPDRPYHFSVLEAVFQNLTESHTGQTIEYYTEFVRQLQHANFMSKFVGDDPEERIATAPIPEAEEVVEPGQRKKNKILSFSRILAMDEEGNAVNFMSTNGVP
uniref:Uncharacterized protein n=1 Tax=Caenorhabditis japonica TaxID=281687 RepID=A0A8R1ERX5_CAEJA